MGVKLIIGADRGIAHALALQLHERGEDVIAAVMGDGADLAVAGITVYPGLDVTSDDAVTRMTGRLEADGVVVDWLVNVAGVMFLDTIDTVDFDDVRRQFEINTLGPLRVARAVRPFLRPGSKVGIFTSRVGSMADNSSGGDYAYRISKAAANMVARNLSVDLGKEGVAVQALHPGLANTHLLDVMSEEDREQAAAILTTPEKAASGVIAVLDALSPENAGQFQHGNGAILPW
jgi:NAD(P)-dependent dehydrogenase (short-subunit alcohol dehydrogenase family)